jgi:hypothetical protein
MKFNINIILIITLLSALITISIYYYLEYYANYKSLKNLEYSYTNIKNKLKNGDLILMSRNDMSGNIVKFFTDDFYTHAGIVFVIENKNYIFEIDNNFQYDYLKKRKKKGVHLVSLDEKMNKYNGKYACIYPLKKKLEFNKVKNTILKYYSFTFENNMLVWLQTILKKKITNNNKLYCTQLTADFYINIGIFNKDKESCVYDFKDLVNSNQFNDKLCFKIK